MKKDIKIYIGIALVVVVIIAAIMIVQNNGSDVDEKITRCIANNSVYYGKLVCPACDKQEEIFGSNSKLLNKVDCFYDFPLCMNATIEFTPTWVIKGEKYVGVQSIERLQELTGC